MADHKLSQQEREAISQVMQRAMTDESVRERALRDPSGALRDAGLSGGVNVRFVERAEGVDAVIPLPARAEDINLGEVSGEESRIFRPVLERAASDADFRQRAVRDPRAAIREVSGSDLPGHVNIQFYDQPSDVDAVLVLPPLVEEAGELSEAELEAVAGGMVSQSDTMAEAWCACTSCCITI